MTPDIVADVGNSRIKWGWRTHEGDRRMISLPPDDEAAWDQACSLLGNLKARWAIAGVHPARRDRFAEWAGTSGTTLVIDDYRQLPLTVDVDEPSAVGIDRLFNAVGLRSYLGEGTNTPGVVIDVGTAVTIDLVRDGCRFVGGAILPGPRLMFDSLHRHTAKLPHIETTEVPDFVTPGKNTRDAMSVGVMAAIVGAAEFLVREYGGEDLNPPKVVLTGGAVGGLAKAHFPTAESVIHDPHLTLDGIRRAAVSLS